MDNKQEMLDCITGYVPALMNASGYSVIPYYNLDNNTISRIKEYFSYDISGDDIVALISTSVMDPGKTGLVFTTSAVYTRDWGFFLILTKTGIGMPTMQLSVHQTILRYMYYNLL